mmetsp:Transcript_3191/g.5042  ORF Transcript_3191/g.5042 Transcript_3191/m.5042 type:complete len:125 (+) Transcript_3191:156-530(+)|eukprot:CAMPEP_0178774190 /NCGR_PEP_ID=MMETSP0744-20121128/23519_1 /TAXON_ID=913974 /ORGANISM="Nitzschia punctata, Strain CCMP561" /LENGTH=124 /DNA_ID=CAMNT_0020431069 /DNA_START=8 /DNA_END=382 /DNA_ORIENTATION=-
MNKFLSFLIAFVAIAQATAFMGAPVLTQRPVAFQQRSGASSMEMRARVCDLLGKKPNRQARVVTFSHKRIKKVQEVNLQWKKFFSDELNRNVRLRLSTKGIKTVNKMGGIDAAAKKFKVDLAKF